jgi:hypothetical protein
MKKIIITNAISIKAKERHSGLKDFEIEGMETKDDFYNAMQVSDEYHTIDELYEHRIELFIVLCRWIRDVDMAEFAKENREIWRSKLHSDGSSFEGWFILGINKEKGRQITYHLPLNRWEDTNFAQTLEKAPEYDGHTPQDVIKRLSSI